MTAANDWASWPCLGFDLETTAANPLDARLVTAALVRVDPRKDTATMTWLADPGVEIPDEAAEIHGITTAKAQADGRPAAEVLDEVIGKLALWLASGWPVAAMNAAYDFTVLEADAGRHDVKPLSARLGGRNKIGPIVDPYVLDKYADQWRKGGRKLVDLCTTYGVTLDDAHTADADALATVRLWPKIIAAHPRKFPGHTLTSLHLGQVQWRRAQMISLRQYFDREGKDHDGCDPGWPVLGTLPEVTT